MKIAIAGILNKPILKNSTGGTEKFTYELISELVKRKHKVYTYANSDSKVKGNLISYSNWAKNINGIVESQVETKILYQLLQGQKITERSAEYDIIHNNYYDSYLLTPFAEWSKCPIITTVHNDFWQFENMRNFFNKTKAPKKNYYVFASETARRLAGDPADSFVIHHGIDINEFKFVEEPKDYIFWLSRISPKKGLHNALEVSLKLNLPLYIAGEPPTKEKYQKYFKEDILSKLGSKNKYLNQPCIKEKISLYGNAKLFMFPIEWEEPFGLVLLEAMACGTPIVAYAKGSVPEIIEDGKTGFIVNYSKEDSRGKWLTKKTGIDGLEDAVKRIYNMSESDYRKMRDNCRKHIKDNFTVSKMVDKYTDLYKKVLEIK